ncbi:hypothetical protein [Saccharicrinis fermentans]|nr:hypothetical protein [Saccharicrinis fermentans]
MMEKSAGFIAAAQSDKYTYGEVGEGGSKYTERTVQNLGEGFESEVTHKKEYNVTYSENEDGERVATATLASETYYTVYEEDGQSYYKTVNINYVENTIDISTKEAEKRENNTKNLN